ncbi:MAG: DUF420 domain-containing protein [Bacteroidetes bacterium]|jgi:putative membrane protein|nr:DUF420 domain-containing protein [Bacteroidota bacterium]
MKLKESIAIPLIIVLSVLIPAVVALLLFGLENLSIVDGLQKGTLPELNAIINSTVTAVLLLGFAFILRRQITAHRACMLTALALSVLFLLSYVVQHAQFESTPYPKSLPTYSLYLFILFSHIVLAVAVVPLALLSIYRGATQQYASHRRIARWTLPIWLYVSITGVVVYLMISPYY